MKNETTDFKFIDFTSKKRVSKSEDGAYAYPKTSVFNVAFSRKVSDIVNLKKLDNIRVRIDTLTDEVFVVFCNNKDSLEVRRNNSGKIFSLSKDLYMYLTDGYIHGMSFHLSDDLSNSNEYAAFKILSTTKEGKVNKTAPWAEDREDNLYKA